MSVIDLNGEAVGFWLWRDRLEGNGTRLFLQRPGCDVNGEAYSNGAGGNVLPFFSIIIAQSQIRIGDPGTILSNKSYSSVLEANGTCTASSGSFSQTHPMHFGGTWNFTPSYHPEQR